MDPTIAKSILDTLYSNVQGYDLSFNARKKLEFHDRGLTYGEIVPDSFYKILSKVSPKKGEVFYDLGSGSGKAVMAASLYFPLSKSVGIELLDDLYEASIRVLERFQTEIRPQMRDVVFPDIEFFHRDFLAHNFSDADIIFAHATCFHDGQIRQLLHQFETLKKGTRLLIVSKSISISSYQLLEISEYPFSWGNATLHFYEKTV